VNNPNFTIDPLRLSIRNLPTSVDVAKLREAVVKHLGQFLGKKEGNADMAKKDRSKAAQALIAKASLIRDSERRTAEGARKSRGFGFIAFQDHASAGEVLKFLNNNPLVFGGTRRPIVEFAIEDKRKLRMQQDLYLKHGHKVLGKDAPAKKKGEDGEEVEVEDGAVKVKKILKKRKDKLKVKKKEGVKVVSRGQRQRENRRIAKVADGDKAKARETYETGKSFNVARKRAERQAQLPKRAKPQREPDAGRASAKRPRAGVGELSDDFELKAMERFRGRR